MKIKKLHPGKYQVEIPELEGVVTIEKWLTYWDVFINDNVSQYFGTYETLRDVKEALRDEKKLSALIRECDEYMSQK